MQQIQIISPDHHHNKLYAFLSKWHSFFSSLHKGKVLPTTTEWQGHFSLTIFINIHKNAMWFCPNKLKLHFLRPWQSPYNSSRTCTSYVNVVLILFLRFDTWHAPACLPIVSHNALISDHAQVVTRQLISQHAVFFLLICHPSISKYKL